MMFDRAAKVAEIASLSWHAKNANVQKYIQTVRSAALFVVEKDQASASIDEQMERDVRELLDAFFMPFDCVCLNIDRAATFVAKQPDNKFYIAHVNYLGIEEVADVCVFTGGVDGFFSGSDVAAIGFTFSITMSGKNVLVREVVGNESGADKKAVDEFSSHLKNAFFQFVAVVNTINEPNKWIVEKTTEKARPVKKGSIPRSDQRPRYIILSDEEMKRKIRIPSGESEKIERAAHRRRAHLALLKSERYKHKRGQYVKVSACWVGPQEFRERGEIYKVLIDK